MSICFDHCVTPSPACPNWEKQRLGWEEMVTRMVADWCGRNGEYERRDRVHQWRASCTL